MSHFQISLLVILTLSVGLWVTSMWLVARFFKAHAVTIIDAGKGEAHGQVVLRKRHLGEARTTLREKYAKDAVAYAKQIGADTKRKKLDHAIGYFQKMDAEDNGHRDFTDAEIRLAIEAALGSDV